MTAAKLICNAAAGHLAPGASGYEKIHRPLCEYDSVRVVGLEGNDRWPEGPPSVGDIERLSTSAAPWADTKYIVELGESAGLTPLFMAGIAGAIGGFPVNRYLMRWSSRSVWRCQLADSSLPRTIMLAIAAGLAIGKLVGSVVYEILEFRHSGRS